MEKVTISLTDSLLKQLNQIQEEYELSSLTSALRLLLFSKADILVIKQWIDKNHTDTIKRINNNFEKYGANCPFWKNLLNSNEVIRK